MPFQDCLLGCLEGSSFFNTETIELFPSFKDLGVLLWTLQYHFDDEPGPHRLLSFIGLAQRLTRKLRGLVIRHVPPTFDFGSGRQIRSLPSHSLSRGILYLKILSFVVGLVYLETYVVLSNVMDCFRRILFSQVRTGGKSRPEQGLFSCYTV